MLFTSPCSTRHRIGLGVENNFQSLLITSHAARGIELDLVLKQNPVNADNQPWSTRHQIGPGVENNIQSMLITSHAARGIE